MRTLISLFVVLAMSLAASAADLAATSSDLATAMADRVAELGKPAKGTPEKLEQKQLKKAGKSLRKFEGVLDRQGVVALLKCGKALVKSGTTDTDTTDAAEALLDCVLTALADQEAALLVDAEALFAPSDLDTLPYVLKDDLANFVMYPTMYAAVEAAVGPNPVGDVRGAIHFKSTKHGKADIPVDMTLFAP